MYEPVGIRTVELMKRPKEEDRQIREVRAAIRELDAGRGVSHEAVVVWLKSWGTAHEKKAPKR